MLIFIGWTYESICAFLMVFICLLQEMIIDKVNGQPVPRYLIYDIIKFTVSAFQQH